LLEQPTFGQDVPIALMPAKNCFLWRFSGIGGVRRDEKLPDITALLILSVQNFFFDLLPLEAVYEAFPSDLKQYGGNGKQAGPARVPSV